MKLLVPSRTKSTISFARGFTLLEMLVVLVIIGLLVGLVGPRLFTKVDAAKVQTAVAQIKLLRGAVKTMRLDINVYPTEEQGLRYLPYHLPTGRWLTAGKDLIWMVQCH